MFSIYLARGATKSNIMFGGFDTANYAKEGLNDSNIYWARAMMGEKFWTVRLNQIMLKNAKSADILQVQPRYLILDTGASYSMVPEKEFEVLMRQFASFGVSCIAPKDSSDLVSTHTCNVGNFDTIPDVQLEITSGLDSVKG